MVKVIGLRLSKIGKIYDFMPGDSEFKIREWAVVETSQGKELGQVIYINKNIRKSKSLRPVLRKASPSDLKRLEEFRQEKKKTLEACRKKIEKYNLGMKLIDCELSFDGRRLTFYFTSEERVDFRELVKDLASTFKKQIRLQQIGPRDEMKFFPPMYGPCGQPLCCLRFLQNLGGVTTEMVRLQDIKQAGAGKISGVCGRFMCCLAFEIDLYKELTKKLPQVGKIIKTPSGKGKIIEVFPLRGEIEVLLEDKKRAIFKVEELNLRKK